MAGRGPKPKEERVRTPEPERGNMRVAADTGWGHTIPVPPDGLLPASIEAWTTWFAAWFAAFWTPSDVPALRQLVRLFDQVERGEFQRSSELRLMMDTYGITPKGQQDRRWKPPPAPVQGAGPTDGGTGYRHLRPA